MLEASLSLLEKIRLYSPGDLLEAADLQEELEKLIVHEQTPVDESAQLSKVLDEFSA